MTLPCKYYDELLFNDRKLMLYGIPIVALMVPVLLLGYTFKEYVQDFIPIYFESFMHTITIWFSLRYLAIYFRRMYPEIHQTVKRVIVLLLAAFVVIFTISKLVGIFLNVIFRICSFENMAEPSFIVGVLGTYFIAISIFSTYEAVYYFKKFRFAIAEQEKLKTAHVQTQLDNLRNQINPHFLFNSLNTLMNLIPRDQDRAMNYLDKLSKFYRYSVGKNEDAVVLLTKEIKNAKIYADLLHERFGENINIIIRNGVPYDVSILPMTLQLLIENAVKHNIVSKNKPLNIEVFTTIEGDYISVRNNLQKKIQSVQSTGMGLENIKERFAYFTNKEIKITNGQGVYEVSIPLIQEQVPV